MYQFLFNFSVRLLYGHVKPLIHWYQPSPICNFLSAKCLLLFKLSSTFSGMVEEQKELWEAWYNILQCFSHSCIRQQRPESVVALFGIKEQTHETWHCVGVWHGQEARPGCGNACAMHATVPGNCVVASLPHTGCKNCLDWENRQWPIFLCCHQSF